VAGRADLNNTICVQNVAQCPVTFSIFWKFIFPAQYPGKRGGTKEDQIVHHGKESLYFAPLHSSDQSVIFFSAFLSLCLPLHRFIFLIYRLIFFQSLFIALHMEDTV
jgi:hypothetical protein